MNQLIDKIWLGAKKGLKWVAIQYAVIIGLLLLICLGLCIYSLFVNAAVREILMKNPLTEHSFYTWRTGLLVAIPIYTLLFGWWNAFFTERKHWWTYIIPWLFFMLLFYLHISKGLDWNFRMITVDEYMLGGWLAPILGIVLHNTVIRRKQQSI